ncbi:MAG: 50S ribosomal protein L18 [bacterium]
MTETKLTIKKGKIFGTSERPRVCVFRSNTALYAQIIDDNAGKTLFAHSTNEVKAAKAPERYIELGKLIAESAKAKKITNMLFDRNGYRYHGKVKTLADGIREGGIKI